MKGFIGICISLFSVALYGQQIEIKSNLLKGNTFLLQGIEVPKSVIEKAIKIDPKAFDFFKDGIRYQAIGRASQAVGGVGLAIYLGQAISGNNPNEIFLGTGFIIGVGGLYAWYLGTQKLQEAFEIFLRGIFRSTTSSFNIQSIRLKVYFKGAGLEFVF